MPPPQQPRAPAWSGSWSTSPAALGDAEHSQVPRVRPPSWGFQGSAPKACGVRAEPAERLMRGRVPPSVGSKEEAVRQENEEGGLAQSHEGKNGLWENDFARGPPPGTLCLKASEPRQRLGKLRSVLGQG